MVADVASSTAASVVSTATLAKTNIPTRCLRSCLASWLDSDYRLSSYVVSLDPPADLTA
jgi:hypothetical protein